MRCPEQERIRRVINRRAHRCEAEANGPKQGECAHCKEVAPLDRDWGICEVCFNAL
jgi:hypothetical protein